MSDGDPTHDRGGDMSDDVKYVPPGKVRQWWCYGCTAVHEARAEYFAGAVWLVPCPRMVHGDMLAPAGFLGVWVDEATPAWRELHGL